VKRKKSFQSQQVNKLNKDDMNNLNRDEFGSINVEMNLNNGSNQDKNSPKHSE